MAQILFWFKKINLNKALVGVVGVFSAWILTRLFLRLRYGVDIQDESYYAALPWTHLLGHIPFVEETSVLQVQGLLTYPFVKAYVSLNNGSNEGLIYALRLFFIFIQLLVAFATYKFSRKYLGFAESVIIGLLLVSFVPFCIPALSYNTMGMYLLFLIFLIQAGFLEKPIFDYRVLPLTFFSMVLVALYPTLILTIFISTLIVALVWLRGGRRIGKGWSVSLLGMLLLVITAIGLIKYVSVGRLREILEFGSSYGFTGGGLGKIAKILNPLWEGRSPLVWAGLLFALVLYLGNKKPIISLICILLWFYFYKTVWITQTTMCPHHLLMVAISLGGVFSILILNFSSLWTRLPLGIIYIIMMGVLGGLNTAWSSSNGLMNFVIGGFGAMLGLLIGIQYKQRFVGVILGMGLVYFSLYTYDTDVYGDNLKKDLTTQMSEGPYRGLFTTPSRFEYLQKLGKDINEVAGSGAHSIAFYDFMVFGYLMTNLKPQTPIIWTYSLAQFPQKREILAKYYKSNEVPDVLFWAKSLNVLKDLRFELKYSGKDELKDVLFSTEEFKLVRMCDEYDVYMRSFKK